MGVYAAYWRGGRLDNTVRVGSVSGRLPSFWFGLILILVFAVHSSAARGRRGRDRPHHPAGPHAGLRTDRRLVRLLRSSVIEELSSDYVTFLRMKGMSERKILWKHVLRNAGLTALTFVGILIVEPVTGSVLVETVFVWPGIGRLMIEAIDYRDFAVVQGVSW